MFKIFNGREAFYQWDLNQKLIVNDISVNEVHFCNRTDDCSLVCEVYEADGLRLVEVPNILLQDTYPVKVYAVCEDYTKLCATYKVLARTKPADYVYTETEVKTWEALEKKIDESITDEKIEEVVTDYLAANPPKAGVTSWDELEDKPFETVEVGIPGTQLYSGNVYITLDGYNTFDTSIFTVDKYYIVRFDGVEYCCQCKEVTWREEGTSTAQYHTVKYIGNGAITEEYSTIDTGEPFLIEHHTNTQAAFNNQSHIYTTEEYYGTEVDVAVFNALFETEIHTIEEKYIPSTIARVSDIPSTADFATKTYVDKAIEEIDFPSTPDLSGYALKSDIPTVPTKVSAFENDKGYLTSVPGEYVTETELAQKGYLTQHQDLSSYAKKTDIPTVPTKVSQLENDKGYLTQHQSLEGYALKTDIPTLDGYATESYVDDAIAGIDVGGGGSSDIKVCRIYDGNNLSFNERLTEENKALLMDYVNYANEHNGAPMPNFICEIVRITSYNTIKYRATGIEIDDWNIRIYYLTNNGYYLYYQFPYSNGVITDYYQYPQEIAVELATWQKYSGNGNNIYLYSNNIGNSSMIKIVGYWDDDTNNMETFDITTSYGNNFYEELGARYYVSSNYCLKKYWNDRNEIVDMYWQNSGEYLDFYINGDTNYEFTVCGIYVYK